MTIRYVQGDATAPKAPGNKIIVHICNDVGGWGAGFVLALSKRWTDPENQYRVWHRTQKDFRLGAVQLVGVEDDMWVANLIGQEGLGRRAGKPPIRYPAVRDGLAAVAAHATEKSASVHMPRIGCGLAGGKWEEIEPIIEEELVAKGVDVTVYDFR